MVRQKLHIWLAAAGIGLAVALLGYAGWSAHQKRVYREAVAAAVGDTTARLRESLASKVEPKKIEAHAAAADAHLEILRQDAARDRRLADGAEHYLIGAREIFKRQIALAGISERAAAEKNALTTHMGRAARRDRAWINDAMVRKKKVEAEYFDYNLALAGLSELLWTLPQTRKQLMAHVPETALLEVGPAEDAYRRVQQEAKRVASELESIRRLN